MANLLLNLCPPRLCCRPITFTKTLATSAISPLDKARGQIVASTVAAHEFLCFRLTPGLLHRRSCGLGVCWFNLLTVCQFRAFHSPGSPSALTAGHGCLLCSAHEASDGRRVSSETT